jgi:hypothetical protein
MSYARRGAESDVYIFSDGVYVICMDCELAINGGTIAETHYGPMIAHLEEHRARGHKVPESAFARLREEERLSAVVAEARLEGDDF